MSEKTGDGINSKLASAVEGPDTRAKGDHLNKLWNYIEPNTILTILSVICLFEFYVYINSFYNRLAIPITGFDVPISFYVKIILFVVVIGLYLNIYWDVDAQAYIRRSKRQKVFNTILWILAIVASYSLYKYLELYKMYPISDFTFFPVFMLIALMFLADMCEFTKNRTLRSYIEMFIRHKRDSNDLRIILIFLVTIVYFLSSFMAFMGEKEAERFIEGRSSDSLEISLEFNSGYKGQFENKTLLLVMYQNNAYYVIEKNEPAPRDPKSYIIPASQVEIAIIKQNKYDWSNYLNNVTIKTGALFDLSTNTERIFNEIRTQSDLSR